jgi:hypothetical protein
LNARLVMGHKPDGMPGVRSSRRLSRGALLVRAALALVGFAVLLLVSSPLRAQAEEGAVLVVEVEPGGSAIDPEAVRRVVAAELRIDVVDAPVAEALGVLSVELSRAQVSMSYLSREGQEVSRAVSLPQELDQQLQVIALLAGNLARDEAGELLAWMRATQAAVAEAESEPEAAADQQAAPEPPRAEPKAQRALP